MRILQVHANLPSDRDPQVIGGAEVSVTMLANALAEGGAEVLAIRGIAPDRQGYTQPVGKFDVVALPIRRPYWVYDSTSRTRLEKCLWHGLDDVGASPKAIDEILGRFRPDVALLHNVTAIGWRIADRLKAFGVPVIQTLHDYYFLCARMTRFRNGRICTRQCLDCRVFTSQRRNVEKRIDAVVGVSQAMLDIHSEAGVFNNVPIRRVISNAVDITITPIERAWPELRLGFLGRISPEKGLELLATSVAKLPKQSRLLIAGAVDEAGRTRLNSIAHGRITFLGFVRPDALFRQIDVLVVPSLWDEPFGRVSVEAQAFGVPSIVARRGGLPLTIDHGAVGWMFEPSSPDTLDVILAELAENKKCILDKSRNIPGTVTKFSREAYVEKYRTLIREVLGTAA